MTIYDDIKTDNEIGDPEHPEQHNLLGEAAKDLNTRLNTNAADIEALGGRVDTLEAGGGGGGGGNNYVTSIPKLTLRAYFEGTVEDPAEKSVFFTLGDPDDSPISFTVTDLNNNDFDTVAKSLTVGSWVQIINPTVSFRILGLLNEEFTVGTGGLLEASLTQVTSEGTIPSEATEVLVEFGIFPTADSGIDFDTVLAVNAETPRDFVQDSGTGERTVFTPGGITVENTDSVFVIDSESVRFGDATPTSPTAGSVKKTNTLNEDGIVHTHREWSSGVASTEFDTEVVFTKPTADREIVIPNKSGEVVLLNISGLIEHTQLPGPTTTEKGAARFATVPEALAGLLDNVVINPYALKQVLLGMNPSVYVLEEGADTSAIPDGSLIGFIDPSGPRVAGVTFQGQVISNATGSITITTTADIPVGDDLFVAVVRGAASSTGGGAAVSTAAGALASATGKRASAQRAGTVDVNLVARRVTTMIPAGTVLTITTTGNTVNRVMAAAYSVSNLDDGSFNATSGDDAAGVASTSSAGANANSTTLSPSTDATTSVPDTFVFGVWGGNSSVDWEVQSPGIEGVDIQTTYGSADRFLLVGWKQVSMSSVQSLTAQSGGTGAAAAVVVACAVIVD